MRDYQSRQFNDGYGRGRENWRENVYERDYQHHDDRDYQYHDRRRNRFDDKRRQARHPDTYDSRDERYGRDRHRYDPREFTDRRPTRRESWVERSRGRSRSRSRSSSCDSEGHISSRIDRITDRFLVEKQLDKGTFGAVFRAYDRKHRDVVAIKVVRRVKRYVEDALIEVNILEKLCRMDKEGRFCVQMYKCFHYDHHFCIVTELLGKSLYLALKNQKHRPRPGVRPNTLRIISKQLCECMQFLREAGLIHADLKTENVLLQHPDMTLDDPNPRVKLIDFGAATWDEDDHGTIIQTRHYRAPEVVLGLPWTFPCDMWSIACIILEL
mmetsp:Transcript_35064/g.109575  ORF Transcript_35064/g.109575 Transcript_35064/m.109575 type:complete len:326 (+) Transcript_35064:84-1061(+)